MRSKDPLQIAFVGTYPPSRCGIGTFTHDLSDAVMTTDEGIGATVLAMTAADFDSEYPERVRFRIRREVQDDYARAARFVNDGDTRPPLRLLRGRQREGADRHAADAAGERFR